MRAGTAAGHGGAMKPTQALHEAGQSRWLDNITRALPDEGARHEQLARTA